MAQVAGFDIVCPRSNRPPQSDAVAETGAIAGPSRNTQLIAIRELRPTQMTVGYREVAERRRLRRAAAGAGDGAFPNLIVPVVLGPCGRSYILDRHHELCLRATEGVADVQVAVVDDLRRLEWVGFWRTLDRRGWCRPQDDHGQRQDYSYIPTTIAGLADDPFRSLARALRRAGGYVKQKALFSDFLWTDFLRQRISRTHVYDDFEAALREAITLARNGGPITGPEQALHCKGQRLISGNAPGPPTNSSALGLLNAVSTVGARERTSTDNAGKET